jgi:hypothetical protein
MVESKQLLLRVADLERLASDFVTFAADLDKIMRCFLCTCG